MYRCNKRCVRYAPIPLSIAIFAYVYTYHYQAAIAHDTGGTDGITKTYPIGQTYTTFDSKSGSTIDEGESNPHLKKDVTISPGAKNTKHDKNDPITKSSRVLSPVRRFHEQPDTVNKSILDFEKHSERFVDRLEASTYRNNRTQANRNETNIKQENGINYDRGHDKGDISATERKDTITLKDKGKSHIERNVSTAFPVKDTHLIEGKATATFNRYFEHLNVHPEKKFITVGTRHSIGTQRRYYSMMSDYWKKVDDGIGKDNKLYQNGFNVDEVLMKIKAAKILNITFFLDRPTMKWILTLEGGQRVLFKPDLNAPNMCESGCEHPAFEITGFAINKMLGLNSMPFTTSRALDWFKDIHPISSKSFRESFKVFNQTSKHKEETRVCVKWTCALRTASEYCFHRGQITGSVMYWVNRDVVELRNFNPILHQYNRFHPMYFRSFNPNMKAHALSTGDTRFCDKFRKKLPYKESSNFLYVLDMSVQDFLTQSKNSKHNIMYLNNTGSAFINVDIDKGKGFCRHKDDLLLAPVYQCCKIRRSVYLKLLEMNGSFVDRFMTVTHLEPKGSLVNRKQLEAIGSRVETLLRYIETCFTLKGKEYVLV